MGFNWIAVFTIMKISSSLIYAETNLDFNFGYGSSLRVNRKTPGKSCIDNLTRIENEFYVHF